MGYPANLCVIYKKYNIIEFSVLLFFIFFFLYTGSLLFIFHPTGSFMSGFLQERFGRKRCMIFANIPSIFGWVMLYFADSIFLIYTSTVLMGLGIGFSEAPILSYVGEITEPRLRGSMTSLATASAFFGMSILFILNYFFEWRTVALLSMLCPIICICLLMMVICYEKIDLFIFCEYITFLSVFIFRFQNPLFGSSLKGNRKKLRRLYVG